MDDLIALLDTATYINVNDTFYIFNRILIQNGSFDVVEKAEEGSSVFCYHM